MYDDIPEVWKFTEHLDHFSWLGRVLIVIGPTGTRGETHRHGTGVAHCFFGLDDELAQETRSILQRPAIFICSSIRRKQELSDQVPVSCIDIHDVETSALGTFGCIEMPSLQVFDIGFVHCAGLDRIPYTRGLTRRTQRCLSGVEVRAPGPTVP